MEKDQKERERIEHFSHEHSLVLNEEQSDESKEACCRACLEPLLGPIFSCAECEFHLHKKCAQAPLEITNSPFHCKQSALTLEAKGPFCDLCKDNRTMFYYCCSLCPVSLDIKCALLLHNIDQNFRELKYVAHEHPLTFIENPNDELKRADCYWCQKPLVDSFYACLDCRFYLHKKCAQLPTQLNHPWHRKHTLYIEDAYLVCKVCQREHWSLFYRCLPCKLDIDIECVLSKTWFIVEYKNHHEHSFTLLLRDLGDIFVCDACGTEANYVPYICSTCHIVIHEKCISLPRIIKTTRHHHCIMHNYFFQKKELEKKDCGICLSEVKAEYGSYNCLKQDCNYVAHVNCALDSEMYEIIDQVNDQDEESSENLATNSSITCVLERNEHGEATKIKHFSHEHDLILGNKLKEDDDRHCDGCMLSISTLFYYCSQCEFFLHKTCAELPRKKHHWFHRSLTTLNSVDFFRCNRCNRLCSGFFYKSGRANFCLRCARISHTLGLTSQGHMHSLFFDFKFSGKCNACGATCYDGAYKCKDCTFALDFACITLPQEIRHKCDKHFLKLTYLDENDDPEQHYCDICEKRRDPTHWFYHCEICDNSAHSRCVLGKYPFMRIKIGSTFPYDDHPHRHPLIFVKKIYETCSFCGKPFQGVALQCTDSTCNYVIHYDCWSWGRDM
ncbi:uncharacterized protein LOC111309552 [Durio zibethinus]|uniref:Uncharacterized protein LOC111309552 n=1 Tax=Durio zibethinus TaxID=66656 RepID=A0A6P6AHP0_DURZI|nr:uncharacterized protein LOC111309552 [Durio zibethinus]